MSTSKPVPHKQREQRVITTRSLLASRLQEQHAHLQVVPVPLELLGTARVVFESQFRQLGADFDVLPPGQNLKAYFEDVVPFYFSVELPGKETGKG